MYIADDLAAAPAIPLVLAVLAEGEHDGYAVVQRVRQLAGRERAWADGMLYPLLHRLDRLGYVTSAWRARSEGRRRRYYAITSTGQRACARLGRGSAIAAVPSTGPSDGMLLISGDRRDRLRRARPALCPAAMGVAVLGSGGSR